MRWAKSHLDGREWEADEFDRQAVDFQCQLRGTLSCIACGAPAVFQSSSAKRRPTFSASHRHGCVVRTPGWGVFRYLT